MTNVRFKVEGAKDIIISLEKYKDKIRPEIQKALDKGAQIIADEAKRIAPLGPTGNLKKGIYAKEMPYKKYSPSVAIVTVDRHIAPHSHLVEFGTGVRIGKKGKAGYIGKSFGIMPARPFLRPAFDSKKSEVERFVKNYLKNELIKVSAK